MPSDFSAAFTALRALLATQAKYLTVTTDTDSEYTLGTKSPSPFPQHKGAPLGFGSVRLGRAYVSYHLVPLYMCPELKESITAGLRKRMQGKSCFNFKAAPEADVAAELKTLTESARKLWHKRKLL